MFLRLMVCSVSCALLVACGGPTRVEIDGGARGDGAIASTGTIVLETESAVGIEPGGEATFRVRWIDPSGAPVVGGAIGFGIEGMPRGSTLRALSATTDREGRAEGSIVGGALPAAFRVRATAPGASPAYVDVAVGADGFGRILVEVRGGEGRAIATRRALLHLDTTCDAALMRREGDRMRDLAEGETTTEFATLPAGQVFAVVVLGISELDAVVASGCVEGVQVPVEGSIRAIVELALQPLQVGGEYATTLAIESAGAGALVHDTVAPALEAAVALSGGDAVMLLDALEADLRDRGHDASADVLAAERATGDAEAELAAALDASGASPSRAIAGALEALAPGLDAPEVSGTLAIAADPEGGALASFARERVRIELASGDHADVDLAALGVDARRPAIVRWDGTADALVIDELDVELPVGTLWVGALDALARARGAEDAVGLLAGEGGCAELDAFVDARATLRSACDADCALAVCRGVIDATLAATTTAARTLDVARGDLVLGGTLACEDIAGDLAVDAMHGSGLTGSWRSADGSEAAPVAASVEASRLAVLP